MRMVQSLKKLNKFRADEDLPPLNAASYFRWFTKTIRSARA